MEYCSNQCRRALYAVVIGMSPIAACLIIMGIIRIFIHVLEMNCSRRRKLQDRRRSSSLFYQAGRPTILYTPVSIAELQRIIQGDHQSQQPTESSSSIQHTDKDSPKASKFMKSLLSKRDSPPSSTGTISNLVGRRNALNGIPFTALFAPVSSVPVAQFDTVNEQKLQRPCFSLSKKDSFERPTLSMIHTNSYRFNRTDSSESELADTDPLLMLPVKKKSTTNTNSNLVLEDSPDFHSARSVPYFMN